MHDKDIRHTCFASINTSAHVHCTSDISKSNPPSNRCSLEASCMYMYIHAGQFTCIIIIYNVSKIYPIINSIVGHYWLRIRLFRNFLQHLRYILPNHKPGQTKQTELHNKNIVNNSQQQSNASDLKLNNVVHENIVQ